MGGNHKKTLQIVNGQIFYPEEDSSCGEIALLATLCPYLVELSSWRENWYELFKPECLRRTSCVPVL